MKEFPTIPRKVSPLYQNKESSLIKDALNRIRNKNTVAPSPNPVNYLQLNPRIAFDYQGSLKIIESTMYEPVSDHCPTTVVRKSNYSNQNSFEQSNELNKDCNGCEDHLINELVPPEKPPRRNKLHKQLMNSQKNNDVTKTLCNNNKMRPGTGDNCIDIDNINLESNNYKNRYKNVSVQTSLLIPYRLRFWPRSSCTVKCDPNEKTCTKIRLKCCCRVLSQWFLSQVGLTIIIILWALLGAYAFYKTEGPRESEQSKHLTQLQEQLSIELATSLRLIDQYKNKWPQTINKYMEKHETLLLEAVSAGFGEGGGGSIWTYPGCILFAVSLLTTLGFGAPVPRTALGRGAAILFSAIGIPLHFLLILNMGNLVAVKLQRIAYYHNGSPTTDIPTSSKQPKWLKWFPLIIILFYYFMGVILFGFVRQRNIIDCFMFPLDFTAAGGVANTYGHVRILYALYLEIAVTLAALVVSLLQASATRGIVDTGLRLGLLTNT